MELMADEHRRRRFKVRVTRAYWNLIVTIKHPVMAGREKQVTDTLQNPREIRQSKSDPNVYLFYKGRRGLSVGLCAVSKRVNSEGFLVWQY